MMGSGASGSWLGRVSQCRSCAGGVCQPRVNFIICFKYKYHAACSICVQAAAEAPEAALPNLDEPWQKIKLLFCVLASRKTCAGLCVFVCIMCLSQVKLGGEKVHVCFLLCNIALCVCVFVMLFMCILCLCTCVVMCVPVARASAGLSVCLGVCACVGGSNKRW